MKKLRYSPDYTERIRNLKKHLSDHFGHEVSKRIIKEIGTKVRSLKDNDRLGYSVQEMYGVDTDCLCIFVSKNYVFYRVNDEGIYIVNIYNEREDFMMDLFGIKTTSEETEDYWDE